MTWIIKMPGSHVVERVLRVALVLGLAIWAVLAIRATFAMSLGTDEAWVLNGLRSTLHPFTDQLSTELITTNGGLFALANLLVEATVGNDVWAHRLVSLACLAGALVMALRLSRLALHRPAGVEVQCAMAATILAVPASAEIGTAALGTSAGVFFLLAALVAWWDRPTRSARRVVASGLLLGLAIASRFDILLFVPALLVTSCVRTSGQGRIAFELDWKAVAMLAVSAVVVAANQSAMHFSAVAVDAQERAAASGLSDWYLTYSKIRTGAMLAPWALLAVAAACAFVVDAAPARAGERQHAPVPVTLLLGGVSMAIGWYLRSPIPHLRYLWPSLVCFAILGAIAIGRVLTTPGQTRRARICCLVIALACVWGNLGPSFRSVQFSDTDIVSWEWSHEVAFDNFRAVRSKADQARVAAYVRDEIPATAAVYSYLPFPIRYLSGRPVYPLENLPATADAGSGERFLILTPMIGTLYNLPSSAPAWFEANTELVQQFGRYAVYRLHPMADVHARSLVPVRSIYVGHPLSRP